MKKITLFLLVLIISCTMLFAGGASDKAEENSEEPLKIMQYVVDALGAMSCDDLVNAALIQFCDEFYFGAKHICQGIQPGKEGLRACPLVLDRLV